MRTTKAKVVLKPRRISAQQRARQLACQRAYRRYVQRALKSGYVWVHVGGGAWIGPVVGSKTFQKFVAKYPCDDQYENLKTGEMVFLATTIDAHFNTLRGKRKLKSLREVLRLPGVKLSKRVPKE